MMAVVHALDDYYLAITLLITIAYQLFFFSIAFSLKFDKLTGNIYTHHLFDVSNLLDQILPAGPTSSSWQ